MRVIGTPEINKTLLACFAIAILFSLFFLFNNNQLQGFTFTPGDEGLNIIAGLKLTSLNNPFDARLYNVEHPPIAKFVLGIGLRMIFPEKELSWADNVPKEYNDSVLDIPPKIFYAARIIILLFFLSCILLFYFIGQMFPKPIGNISALLAATFLPFLYFSNRAYIDIISVFFLLLVVGSYLEWKQNKTVKHYFGFFIITILFLGTRALSPLIVLPAYIMAEFNIGKRQGLLAIAMSAIMLLIFFTFVYPFDYLLFSQTVLKTQLPMLSIFNLSLLPCLYLIPYIAILLMDKSRKKYSGNPFVFWLFFFYFLFFSLTYMGNTPRYLMLLFVPFFFVFGNSFGGDFDGIDRFFKSSKGSKE